MKNLLFSFFKSSVAFLGLSVSVHAATLVPGPALFWNFDTASDNVTPSLSGTSGSMPLTMYNGDRVVADMLGASGSGVSGASGDRALDLTSSTGMGNNGTPPNIGGAAYGSNLVTALGQSTARSMTLAGWFYAETKILSNTQFFNQSNADTDGFRLFGASAEGRLSLNIVGTTGRRTYSSASAANYGAVGEWVFFAVTFDNSDGLGVVNYYYGSATDGVELDSSASVAIGDFKVGASPLTIGNFTGSTGPSTGYPFQGLFDNFGMWISPDDGTGALTLQQLEGLRVSQIPEASSVAILTLGATFLGGGYLLRRVRR